jgi:Zn-finger nucleic acid-binding protein
MQTVDRAGVQFDMCPSCRGVWLDRGELEKLMSAGAQNAGSPSQAGTHFAPPPQSYGGGFGERGEHGERGEYGERGEHGHGGHHRKRGSIFDIFD